MSQVSRSRNKKTSPSRSAPPPVADAVCSFSSSPLLVVCWSCCLWFGCSHGDQRSRKSDDPKPRETLHIPHRAFPVTRPIGGRGSPRQAQALCKAGGWLGALGLKSPRHAICCCRVHFFSTSPPAQPKIKSLDEEVDTSANSCIKHP